MTEEEKKVQSSPEHGDASTEQNGGSASDVPAKGKPRRSNKYLKHTAAVIDIYKETQKAAEAVALLSQKGINVPREFILRIWRENNLQASRDYDISQRKKLTPEQEAILIRCNAEKKSTVDSAKEVGVNPATVSRFWARKGLKPAIRRRIFTDAEKETLLKDHAAGKTGEEAAKSFKVTVASVYAFWRSRGLKPNIRRMESLTATQQEILIKCHKEGKSLRDSAKEATTNMTKVAEFWESKGYPPTHANPRRVVAEEEKTMILKTFERLGSISMTQKVMAGSGLGRDLIRAIVVENGGKIKIEAPPGTHTSKEAVDAAVEKLRQFYTEKKRSPTAYEADKLLGLKGVINAANDNLRAFGIKGYNDLLKLAGLPLNRNLNRFLKKEDVTDALAVLKQFYDDKKVPPCEDDARELGLRTFIEHARGGKFEQFGVGRRFNQILEAAGIPVLFRKWRFKSQEDIDNCFAKLKQFYDEHKRSPTVDDLINMDLNGFYQAARNGSLEQFGIEKGITFAGLLKRLGLPAGKEYKIGEWTQEEVDASIEKLRQFKKEKGNPPTIKDARALSLRKFFTAAEDGELEKFGIKKDSTHNDVLKFAGLPVNVDYGKWSTQEALNEGLEELKAFYIANQRSPTQLETHGLGLGGLLSSVAVGGLAQFGISCYNDLLKVADLPINKEGKKWTTKEGLDEGLSKISDFYKTRGRSPTGAEATAELGLGGLISSAAQGTLKQFNICNYNDLLKAAGAPLNRRRKAKSKVTADRFVELVKAGIPVAEAAKEAAYVQETSLAPFGDVVADASAAEPASSRISRKRENLFWHKSENVDAALTRLKKFFEDNGRSPTVGDAKAIGLGGLASSARNGRLIPFGIKSWNDILSKAGLPLNSEPNKIITQEELDTTIKTIKEFHAKNGRAPTTKEARSPLGIGWFADAIIRGQLRPLGIKSWNDALKKAGAPPNYEPGKWHDEARVKDALAKIKELYEKTGRAPESGEVEEKLDIKGFASAAYTGVLEPFGINSWNGVLKKLGIQPIRDEGRWEKKEEVDSALEKLKNFYTEKQKSPTIKDAREIGLASFAAAASKRGALTQFGIDGWNDVLSKIGAPPNIEHKKWQDEANVKAALAKITGFYKQNGRPPTREEADIDSDFKGFGAIAASGSLKQFGIETWNDALKLAGVPLNRDKEKWSKKEEVDKGVAWVKQFYAENKRSPTQDEAMATGHADFLAAVKQGKLTRVGINATTWNELLSYLELPTNIEMKREWNSQKAVDDMLETLRQFYSTNKRAPTRREIIDDLGFNSFVQAAHTGALAPYGVPKGSNTNDIIRISRIPINRESAIWTNKEAVDRGLETLRKFYQEHKRSPKTSDLSDIGLYGFFQSAALGRLKAFGIGNSYNDLLKAAGLPTNREYGKYDTKEKVEEGLEVLRQFHREHGRAPTFDEATAEPGLSNLQGAAKQGSLGQFGIGKKYNDLIRAAGIPVNLDYGKWKERKGLDRGLAVLKGLCTTLQRTPKKEEALEAGLQGFFTAASRGEYKEFNLPEGTTFNDLLTYANIPVGRESGKSSETVGQNGEQMTVSLAPFGDVVANDLAQLEDAAAKTFAGELILNKNKNPDWTKKENVEIALERIRKFDRANGRPPTYIEPQSLISAPSKRATTNGNHPVPKEATWVNMRFYKRDEALKPTQTPLIIHNAEVLAETAVAAPRQETDSRQKPDYTAEVPAIQKLRKGEPITKKELEEAKASRPVIASMILFESMADKLKEPILDIASGPTSPVAHAAKLVGKSVTCIDRKIYYLGMLREEIGINENASANGYVHGNAFRLPFADGSFNTVTSSYFLDIYRNKERIVQALSEMRRVAAPDGKVIIEVTEAFGKYLPSLKPILEQIGLDATVTVNRQPFADDSEAKSYVLECVPVQPVAIRATVEKIPGTDVAVVEYQGRPKIHIVPEEKEHVVIVNVTEALDNLPEAARHFVMQTILEPVSWRFNMSDRYVEHFKQYNSISIEEAFGRLGVKADLIRTQVVGDNYCNELVLRMTKKAHDELYNTFHDHVINASARHIARNKKKA